MDPRKVFRTKSSILGLSESARLSERIATSSGALSSYDVHDLEQMSAPPTNKSRGLHFIFEGPDT